MLKSTLEMFTKSKMENLYKKQGKSFREISIELGINGRTIKKLLLYYGIDIRYGSEAVQTQWSGKKGLDRRITSREKSKDRIITSDGYYAIKFDGNHRSLDRGRVKEHILVVEDILGRRLEKGEVIHHIDGNKLNNLPSNLQVMTSIEHGRIHGNESGNKIKELFKRGNLNIIRGEKGRIVGVEKLLPVIQ